MKVHHNTQIQVHYSKDFKHTKIIFYPASFHTFSTRARLLRAESDFLVKGGFSVNIRKILCLQIKTSKMYSVNT